MLCLKNWHMITHTHTQTHTRRHKHTDDDKERKLVLAAKENNLKALRKLLASGVDVNSRHILGWSAIHAAIVNGNWDALKELVERGADVNARDEFSTAVRVASQFWVDSSRSKYKSW